MDCTKSGLSPLKVVWPKGYELYPTQFTFSYSKSEFDYFSCQFPAKTANEVKKKIKYEEESKTKDYLTKPTPVSIVVNEVPVRRMYYEPGMMKLGVSDREYEQYGELELKDMHATLGSGVVDMAPDKAPASKIYSKIFNSRKERSIKPKFFTGIDIREETTILEEGNNNTFSFGTTNPFKSNHILPFSVSHAIQIDQATPLEAIEKANEQFGLRTHVDENGTLVVGRYKSRNKYTASRTGKSTSFQITSGRTSSKNGRVERITLNGPRHYPNLTATNPGAGVKFAESAFDWLNPLDDNEESEKKVENGYRLQVIVENTEIANDPKRSGVVRSINAYDVGNDDLARSGERIFMSLESGSGGGNLILDMDNSSNVTVPRISDTVFVAEEKGCGSLEDPAYEAGSYNVAGVEHRYSGRWEAELDLVETTVTEDQLSKKLRVLDLSDGQTHTYKEIYGYTPEEGIPGYNG